jgi:hypothetical protein
MGIGSFPGVESGRGVTLISHPLLVPRSNNRVALYLYSPCKKRVIPTYLVRRVWRCCQYPQNVALNCMMIGEKWVERLWKELFLILSIRLRASMRVSTTSFFTKRNWPKNKRKICFALRVPTFTYILSDRKLLFQYLPAVFRKSLKISSPDSWAVSTDLKPGSAERIYAPYIFTVCVYMCMHVRTHLQYCGAFSLLPWPRDTTSNNGQADARALAFICQASLSEQCCYPYHVTAL